MSDLKAIFKDSHRVELRSEDGARVYARGELKVDYGVAKLDKKSFTSTKSFFICATDDVERLRKKAGEVVELYFRGDLYSVSGVYSDFDGMTRLSLGSSVVKKEGALKPKQSSAKADTRKDAVETENKDAGTLEDETFDSEQDQLESPEDAIFSK